MRRGDAQLGAAVVVAPAVGQAHDARHDRIRHLDRGLEAADAAWAKLDAEDQLEAFRAHPRIGDGGGSAWSRGEQAGVAGAGDEVREAIEERNREYESRFGHVFLVNATGRSAVEMLGELTRRLDNDAEAELAEAAEQQRQITRLRLEKLVRPVAAEDGGGA